MFYGQQSIATLRKADLGDAYISGINVRQYIASGELRTEVVVFLSTGATIVFTGSRGGEWTRSVGPTLDQTNVKRMAIRSSGSLVLAGVDDTGQGARALAYGHWPDLGSSIYSHDWSDLWGGGSLAAWYDGIAYNVLAADYNSPALLYLRLTNSSFNSGFNWESAAAIDISDTVPAGYKNVWRYVIGAVAGWMVYAMVSDDGEVGRIDIIEAVCDDSNNIAWRANRVIETQSFQMAKPQ